MNKIRPIDWRQLDTQVTGKPLDEAVKVVFESLVTKVNEIVALINEQT